MLVKPWCALALVHGSRVGFDGSGRHRRSLLAEPSVASLASLGPTGRLRVTRRGRYGAASPQIFSLRDREIGRRARWEAPKRNDARVAANEHRYGASPRQRSAWWAA